MVQNIRLAHLFVCRSVRKVYCGETADWIRMLFRVMSEVGLDVGILDFGCDRRREMGSFGGEIGDFAA